VITGPDGKPWHSWRVLILPFIDEQKLYDQYKWDEPWDGPNNRKLLDKIPLAYADRVYGENKNYYTHYVAITGDGMAFSPEGVKFEANNLSAAIAGGRRIAEFTDGLSNTLLVGPAGPDRKIPWMKPEDIQIGDEVPAIGAKNGFPAPYKAERGNVAPFLRCDGSVTGLFEGLDKEVFRMMLTRHGGEVVDWDRVPQFNAPQSGQLAPVIYILRDEKGAILRDEKGASARLVMEPAPPGELELVPPPPAVERKPTRPVELKKAE
jgi:hypothetical protein